MREIKFKVWIPYRKLMMQKKSIQIIQESILNGVTVGELKSWIYLQFTGLKDKNEIEIFEGDIVNYAVKEKICTVCSKKEITSAPKFGISRFCPECGLKLSDTDFITTAKVVFDKGGFAYLHENDNDTYQQWPTHAAEMYISWVEVIGNIYEHPELLKPKQYALS